MLDYKHISINPYALNRYSEGSDLGNLFGVGDKVGAFGAAAGDEKRKLNIEKQELRESLNQLVFDEQSGKFILPDILEDRELLQKQKEQSVLAAQSEIGKAQRVAEEQLYKSGAEFSGRTARFLADAEEQFKRSSDIADATYESQFGELQDRSIAVLDEIQEKIIDVAQQARNTGQAGSIYRSAYKSDMYDVGGMEVKYSDLLDNLYQFDYMTGEGIEDEEMI